LRERLVTGIRATIADAVINGDPEPGPTHRLPNIAHVTFPGCLGDNLLMLLDARGIEVSTGSACAAGVPQPSHVLLAMGYDGGVDSAVAAARARRCRATRSPASTWR
jgi:cysteine desulfurase